LSKDQYFQDKLGDQS